MKKLLLLPLLIVMVSCSSLRTPKTTYKEKYQLTQDDMKNWGETISIIVERESLIEDWYGSENPVQYLRKSGTMKEKEFNFLQSLTKKTNLTEDDEAEFLDLTKKYVKKLDRTFKLKDENIKDPSGLVKKVVNESIAIRISNPSKHILEEVATGKERDQIIAWSKQDDLNEKEIKKLRKLFNNFIERKEFYDVTSWQNREMSSRAEEIIDISNLEKVSKDARNNVNAKALYIAYSDYLSELEKWK